MKNDEHPIETAGFTSWVFGGGETHAAERLRTALRSLHESGCAFIPVGGCRDSVMEFADALIRLLQGEFDLAVTGREGLATGF